MNWGSGINYEYEMGISKQLYANALSFQESFIKYKIE